MVAQHAPAIALDVSARATFIMRTYAHLFLAVLSFTVLEWYYFTTGIAEAVARALLGVNWLLVLGGFMVVAWFAGKAAMSAASKQAQYLALAAFVAAESIIFVPLLYLAQSVAPGVIQSAASTTVLGFMGLTAVAYYSRKDFSFLSSLLRWGFLMALVLIACGVLFGFQLGTFFSVGMIALAGGAILHDTSKVLRHYPEDRYVGASLQLFASVALLFWYVLSLFLSRR